MSPDLIFSLASLTALITSSDRLVVAISTPPSLSP